VDQRSPPALATIAPRTAIASAIAFARSAALTALVAIGACAGRNAVWIEEGSTAQRLVFRLAADRETGASPELFYGLSVVTCRDGRVMWNFGVTSGDAPIPVAVTYGTPVPGFPTRSGPEPLTPGCYQVTISGPASTRFRVGADGSVVELKK